MKNACLYKKKSTVHMIGGKLRKKLFVFSVVLLLLSNVCGVFRLAKVKKSSRKSPPNFGDDFFDPSEPVSPFVPDQRFLRV